MSIICTDPRARNYNVDDSLPCYYTIQKNACYIFREVTNQVATPVNESFTASFSMKAGNWVFFHGYQPDMFVHTRDQLYSIKNKKLFEHNTGQPGVYYDPTPQPFMIDVVFNGEDSILNTVSWISSLTDAQGKLVEHSSFTHIMVRSSVQCTGYIPLVDLIAAGADANHRKTMSTFTFNEIRDAVIDRKDDFLSSIFEHYEPVFDPQDVPWYEKALLRDNYFIVRLMHNQSGTRAGEEITLHDVTVDKSKTDR